MISFIESDPLNIEDIVYRVLMRLFLICFFWLCIIQLDSFVDAINTSIMNHFSFLLI